MAAGRLLGVVAALAACAAAGAAAATPRYVTRTAGPWGAAVAVPAAWHVVVVPRTVTQAFLARTERENPPLRQALPSAVRLGVKLLAYEPPAPGAFASNLNMIVDPLPPGMSLRTWLFQGASAAYQAVGTTTTVRIGGVRAIRYVSTKAVRSGTVPLLTEEFAFARGGRVYLFTYTAPAAQARVYRPLFDRSARTIRFGQTA